MKFTKLILIAFVVSGAFYWESCQAVGETGKRAESFVGKNWKMVEFTVSPAIDWDLDGSDDKDIFSLLEPCDKDDFLLFRADQSLIRVGGEVKCDEDEEPEKDDGTWQFDERTKTLRMSKEGKTEESQLYDLTTDGMVLKHIFKSTDGKEHTLTAKYQVK